MTKKTTSIAPILKLIKENKADRKLMQNRVIEFNNELADKINRRTVLMNELGTTQNRVDELLHLIKMYRVMDDHKVHDLWRLEKACGLTKKNCPDWKHEFKQTKEGFEFKT